MSTAILQYYKRNIKLTKCHPADISISRDLARSYFITFNVIFPSHMNLPIRSREVLKDSIHKNKTGNCFILFYLGETFFFQKNFLLIIIFIPVVSQ